jgi:hypothetical protein
MEEYNGRRSYFCLANIFAVLSQNYPYYAYYGVLYEADGRVEVTSKEQPEDYK